MKKNIFLHLAFLMTVLIVSVGHSNPNPQTIRRYYREPLNKLIPLGVDKNSITISGVSAGGFLATQMHLALSSVISGSASVAGGIFGCAEGDPIGAQLKCMQFPTQIKVEHYLSLAKSLEQSQQIESLKNLQKSRVFIYAGQKDTKVNPLASHKLEEFYSALIPKTQIKTKYDIPSGHGWVTNNFGKACASQEIPWINNCSYDLSGDILNTLYGNLKPNTRIYRNSFQQELAIRSNILKFSQEEFMDGSNALYPFGYVYIPKSCQNRRSLCRLHVALHGCQMSPEFIQDQFAVNSGLNTWAEANNIVVLYPQVDKVAQVNPYACWDWYDYTGKDTYYTRNGKQIIALQKMIYRLLGAY